MTGSQHTDRTLTRAAHDALLALLAREQAWIHAAREALLATRRAVVAGNHAELESVLHEQSRLVAERKELAATRPAILARAAEQLGIDAGSATLGRIAAKLSPQARKPMIAARRELLCGARSLRSLAGGAMHLIVSKRSLVDGLLADLLGTSPAEARYTADGHRRDPAGPPLMECRT